MGGESPAPSANKNTQAAATVGVASNADKLMVVDCLLPGQVRQMGRNLTYTSARVALKTTRGECEIRGGEYVISDRANSASALKIWMGSAITGDPQAQVYVGEIYEKGMGVPPDYDLAATWYRKAAKQHYEPAYINLGYLFENGLGVAKDVSSAMAWYRKASKLIGVEVDFASSVTVSQAAQTHAKQEKTYRLTLAQKQQELDVLLTTLKATQGKLIAAESSRQQRSQSKQKYAALAKKLRQQESSTRTATQRLKALQDEKKALAQQLAQQRNNGSGAVSSAQQTAAMQTQYQAAVKQLAAQQHDLARANQRLGVLREEKQVLVSSLDAKQHDNANVQQQTQALRETQQALSLAVEQHAEVALLLDKQGDESQAVNQLLAKIEQEKGALEHALKQQKGKNSDLEVRLKHQQKRTKFLKSIQQQVVAEQPEISIEIIEPPIVVERGLKKTRREHFTMNVMSKPDAKRQVVGRVNAPQALLLFTMNGRKVALDDNGLFTEEVAVGTKVTSVDFVAVDKKGKRTTVSLTFQPEKKAHQQGQRWSYGDIAFGRYKALLIGNETYQYIPQLRTAINDVDALATVLRDQYGFDVTVLHNATRYQMLSALNQYRTQLNKQDNFLLYYAGHGTIDRVNARGHWLPVDAEGDNSANWISNVTLTDTLNSMNAKHIMVVADSCYSGTLTRSSLARLDAGLTDKERYHWIKTMSSNKTRVAFSSGGLAPVLDSGGGEHSIFARSFIATLLDNSNILEGYKFYRKVASEVANLSDNLDFQQKPEYAPIKHSGHAGGEFLFVPTAMKLSQWGYFDRLLSLK